MKRKQMLLAIGAATLAAAAVVAAETSATTSSPVVVDDCAWQIVTTPSVTLRWAQPTSFDLKGATAVTQTLTISGLVGEKKEISLDVADTDYTWTVFEGAAPAADDVFTLVRAYADATGAELWRETAEVAVFRSTFTGRADVSVSDHAWNVRRRGVGIVAYGSDWGDFPPSAPQPPAYSIGKDGNSVSPTLAGTCGFTGWNMKRDTPWGYGVYSFALSIPGSLCAESYAAEIEAIPDGMLFIIH